MKIEILPEYRRQGFATRALQKLMELTCPDYVYAEITNTLSYGLFCTVFGTPIDTNFAADVSQLSKTPGFIGKKYTIDMIFENICWLCVIRILSGTALRGIRDTSRTMSALLLIVPSR